jgi:hypothetical protein
LAFSGFELENRGKASVNCGLFRSRGRSSVTTSGSFGLNSDRAWVDAYFENGSIGSKLSKDWELAGIHRLDCRASDMSKD